MPVAGDEGYEKMVICPYDKAHEIRRGRMQFHLDKCRKNFPNAEVSKCPFNSIHLIPTCELEYHTKEECISRVNWDRHTHEVGDTPCPVKDLVPINAATVPDGDENWDDYEAQGSVLNAIKQQAAEKGIVRMLQCESRAKRKNFRLQERKRHSDLDSSQKSCTTFDTLSEYSDVSSTGPLRKPTKAPTIPVVRQDIATARAKLDTINKQFGNLNLNSKPSYSADTSSMCSEAESDAISLADSEFTSVSQQPISYASMSSRPSKSTPANNSRPSTALSATGSYQSSQQTSTSVSTVPKSSSNSRPSTAMYTALESPSTSRTSSTAMSAAFKTPGSTRPSTAMSIAASVNRSSSSLDKYSALVSSEDGFCQIPIPGLGRGSIRRNKIRQ